MDAPIAQIQELVRAERYRVRSHAVRHMIEEGFDESHLLQALLGKLTVLEEYEGENRYLVLGHFHFSPRSRSPLHVVCDLTLSDIVDIVTAYIPQPPWWINPRQRGQV